MLKSPAKNSSSSSVVDVVWVLFAVDDVRMAIAVDAEEVSVAVDAV
jgi:hypothetical protein